MGGAAAPAGPALAPRARRGCARAWWAPATADPAATRMRTRTGTPWAAPVAAGSGGLAFCYIRRHLVQLTIDI